MRRALIAIAFVALGCTPKEPSTAPSALEAASSQEPVVVASAKPVESHAPPDAAPRRSFLKGQTHVHSDRSYDAKTPPERVLQFYAERGYDFVSITDHNRVTVIEPPAGLLLIPGIELSQNSTVCQPKPTPGYRCLFHMSGLFLDPKLDPKSGERIPLPFQTGRLAAYEEELGIIRKMNGMAVLNHPLFHFAADARMIAALEKEGVGLVEIVNASLDGQHPQGREVAEARAESLWDEALSNGSHVLALATDDAHHFDDASDRARHGKFAYVGDRAWIRVRAEKNPVAIREAIKRGDFYATTGVELRALEESPQGISLRDRPSRSRSLRNALHWPRWEGAGPRRGPRGEVRGARRRRLRAGGDRRGRRTQSLDPAHLAPMSERLFVYGSLLRGREHHGRLAGATFERRAAVARARLVVQGDYPALVLGGEGVVHGEIYRVSAELLADLDVFEDAPRLYTRGVVTLDDGSSAQAYWVSPERAEGLVEIPSGRWTR